MKCPTTIDQISNGKKDGRICQYRYCTKNVG